MTAIVKKESATIYTKGMALTLAPYTKLKNLQFRRPPPIYLRTLPEPNHSISGPARRSVSTQS